MCPHCEREGKKSIIFPANNLGLTPEVAGFLDPNGIYVNPSPVPLFYGCTQGHQFSIKDTKESTITI